MRLSYDYSDLASVDEQGVVFHVRLPIIDDGQGGLFWKVATNHDYLRISRQGTLLEVAANQQQIACIVTTLIVRRK